MATTEADVWQILAQLAIAQKETEQQIRETSQQQKETDRQIQETNQQLKETNQQLKETNQQLKETDKQLKETDKQVRETDKQVRELGKQIGGLGAKFGSFTEGLALPSMESILRQQFGMEIISPSVRASRGGQHLEIDVLAYANSDINTVYVVEVKSHAREDSITQLKSILQRFRNFFPEHQDKQVYGILAAVSMSKNLRIKILQEGLYVAHIQDQVFELDIPENFQPKSY